MVDFDMLDAGDVLYGITFSGGAIFVDLAGYALSNTAANIELAIEAALDAYPITYTSVTVAETGGPLKSFIIVIRDPQFGGSDIQVTNIFINGGSPFYPFVLTDCDEEPHTGDDDIELRSDGGYELRSDGGYELRSP